jgi:hypothetical protein
LTLGSFVPDAPIVRPDTQPVGPLADEAQGLWEGITETRQQVADVDRRHGEALLALRDANAARHAQAASADYDPAAEEELEDAYKEAHRLADPGLHTTRRNAAQARAKQAIAAYAGFVQANAAELIEELKPEAEAATAALVEALAAIEPIRERYYAARASIAAVIEHLADPCCRPGGSPSDARRARGADPRSLHRGAEDAKPDAAHRGSRHG